MSFYCCLAGFGNTAEYTCADTRKNCDTGRPALRCWRFSMVQISWLNTYRPVSGAITLSFPPPPDALYLVNLNAELPDDFKADFQVSILRLPPPNEVFPSSYAFAERPKNTPRQSDRDAVYALPSCKEGIDSVASRFNFLSGQVHQVIGSATIRSAVAI